VGSSRANAALGSLLFLVVAPGIVAGLVPWLLTGWDAGGDVAWPLVVAGAVLVVAGVSVLLHAFARFVVEGIGTPAPVAPTEQLVVGGLYRYVRNPMYLAVAATIVGQAPSNFRSAGGRPAAACAPLLDTVSPDAEHRSVLRSPSRCPRHGIAGRRAPERSHSPIRGPTRVTSGVSCSAHFGGSTPSCSAAIRAK